MFEQIYSLYYQELTKYFIKQVGNREEAEDVVQESFVRAMEHEEDLRDLQPPQIRAWLYRTAKHILIDRIRRRKAEPELNESGLTEEDYSEVMVMQLCEVLAPEDRAIFYLRYFEGYNASELAEMFGQTPSNIRTRLLTARGKLKQLYPELGKRTGKKGIEPWEKN